MTKRYMRNNVIKSKIGGQLNTPTAYSRLGKGEREQPSVRMSALLLQKFVFKVHKQLTPPYVLLHQTHCSDETSRT